MSYPTLSGIPVERARITLPRVGVGHLEVETTEATAPSSAAGSAVLIVDDTTFICTIVRGGEWGQQWKGKLVLGAGGMSTQLTAKFYSGGPSVKTIVTDIMRETGETLSSTADSTVLASVMPKWQRIVGPASRALTAVCDSVGASWRVLPDGTVWIGVDTFPTVTLDGVLMDEDWVSGVTDFAPTAPTLTPGVTFEGHRISYVVHELCHGKLRTEAHQLQPQDSLTLALAGIRQEASYARLWPADVVSQHGDGTLELNPLDDEIRGFGLDNVPIRNGLPGITATVPAGTRVRVGFDGGDPSRPFAALWDSGAVTLVTLGSTGSAQFVALANLALAQLQAIQTWANAHVHTGVTTGPGSSGPPGTPMPAPGSVAATKFKTE